MASKVVCTGQDVEEVLKQAGEPVSVKYVSWRLGISWWAAYRRLIELALKGKIKALKTTKSWIFWVENASGEEK